MDLWDWVGGLLGWIIELIPPKWLALLLLTVALVIWWLYVPYLPN